MRKDYGVGKEKWYLYLYAEIRIKQVCGDRASDEVGCGRGNLRANFKHSTGSNEGRGRGSRRY